ncbi:MAG: carboxymuconolactone decarboxylase family protein, partial [Alphaproteobacteria bacterium]|nr:carboxymuconolactone decarboxylase family protein [Alphaproteobacteria bacterium]
MNDTTAQTNPYPDKLRNFERNMRSLASAQPALMKTFWGHHKAAVAAGALDTKYKELIALAISVAARCDDCIAHHTYDALEAGATKEEIAE